MNQTCHSVNKGSLIKTSTISLKNIIFEAASAGHAETVSALLQGGCDVAVQDFVSFIYSCFRRFSFLDFPFFFFFCFFLFQCINVINRNLIS